MTDRTVICPIVVGLTPAIAVVLATAQVPTVSPRVAPVGVPGAMDEGPRSATSSFPLRAHRRVRQTDDPAKAAQVCGVRQPAASERMSGSCDDTSRSSNNDGRPFTRADFEKLPRHQFRQGTASWPASSILALIFVTVAGLWLGILPMRRIALAAG